LSGIPSLKHHGRWCRGRAGGGRASGRLWTLSSAFPSFVQQRVRQPAIIEEDGKKKEEKENKKKT
jgi:hypothetical protein